VFSWSMGIDSCRGFSIWDNYAPVIAINGSWTAEAREFTLAHELGHLLTRTNSACLETAFRRTGRATDEVERWCESFAAALLLPGDATSEWVKAHVSSGEVVGLDAVTRVARHFRVSFRAAAIRLIELGHAKWSLYKSIPATSDRPRGGGGGAGRTRTQIRLEQYGARTVDIFSAAVGRDVLARSDVVDYLDVPVEGKNAFSGNESL